MTFWNKTLCALCPGVSKINIFFMFVGKYEAGAGGWLGCTNIVQEVREAVSYIILKKNKKTRLSPLVGGYGTFEQMLCWGLPIFPTALLL